MIAKLKSGLLRRMPFSPLLSRGPSGRKLLYLTFDDGPTQAATPQVLDLLQEHGVKASFFCIGSMLEEQPALARRIVADGHLLANHSYRHRAFHRLPLSEQMDEVACTDRLIAELGGRANRYFRMPQGRWSLRLVLALSRIGKVSVHWSRDSEDYRLAAPEIVQGFDSKPVRNGDILLFHDDKPECVAALRELLPRWLAAGYRFGLVSELR